MLYRSPSRITIVSKNKHACFCNSNVFGGNRFFIASRYGRFSRRFSFNPEHQDHVTDDDKVRRTRTGNCYDKITNSSIRRIVKCRCMRVPLTNMLGKLFLCTRARVRVCVCVRLRLDIRADTRNISRKVVRPEPNGRNNFNC